MLLTPETEVECCECSVILYVKEVLDNRGCCPYCDCDAFVRCDGSTSICTAEPRILH